MSGTEPSATEALRLKLMDHDQAVIARLAGNSFLVKGWAITLATALLGIALKDGGPGAAPVGFLAVVPTLCFWLLDAYYLAAERAVRDRYVATAGAAAPSAGATLAVGFADVVRAAFRWMTWLPYAGLIACEWLVGTGRFSAAVATLKL